MSLPLALTALMSAATGVGVGYLLCNRQEDTAEKKVDTFPVILSEPKIEEENTSRYEEVMARRRRREERERQMKEERVEDRRKNMKRLMRDVNAAIVTYNQEPTKDNAFRLLQLAITCNEYLDGKCQYLIDQVFDDFRFSEMEILSLFEKR